MADNGEDMDADGVRRSRFGSPLIEYTAMGQDYIGKAFVRARQANPNVKLILNDYGCEQDNFDKSNRFYNLVSKLLNQGVPIDGVGFQMHVSSVGNGPDYESIARNFRRFRNLGVSIYITEMDVQSSASAVPLTPSQQQEAALKQASVWTQVLEICLNEPACESFLLWDFAEYNSRLANQRYSWLHPITYDPNRAGELTYPSPFFDINPQNFRPKPGWEEMKQTLQNFAANCVDLPFVDNSGDVCQWYEGHPGDCQEYWCDFYRNSQGQTACDQCCVCGGGTTDSAPVQPTTPAPQSAPPTPSPIDPTTPAPQPAVGDSLNGKTFRLTTELHGQDGYLRMVKPDSSRLSVYRLNEMSATWKGLKWQFELVEGNEYRIRNSQDSPGGYLARGGYQDDNGNWFAGDSLYLGGFQPEWSSLRWFVEPLPDGYYLIRCSWGATDGSDYLSHGENGELSMISAGNNPSQRWIFSETVAEGPDDGAYYRISSEWETSSSYLTRDSVQSAPGVWDPVGTLSLYTFDESSAQWGSLKWFFEVVDPAERTFRIANTWDPDSGYLSRAGGQDGNGNWFPLADVYLDPRNTDWTSQMWIIEEYSQGVYTIRCKWSNGDGADYLTRAGGSEPTNSLTVRQFTNDPSQRWIISQTFFQAPDNGGIYRMTSEWATDTSYLSRNGAEWFGNGTWYPTNEVSLYQLETWSSQTWVFELIEGEDSIYRIVNRWEPSTGYLSRDGEQREDGQWYPARTLYLGPSQPTWTSRMWAVEWYTDSTYLLRNLWSDGTDYLTRVGEQQDDGTWNPTSEANFNGDGGYSSQRWILQRVVD